MEDINYLIESITPEQYKKFYSELPLSYFSTINKKEEYINILSNDELQKQLFNILLSNKIDIASVTENSVNILLDLNNAKVIKYLKEHISSTNIKIDVKGIDLKVFSINITYDSKRDIQVLNQILKNYYLVNKSNINNECNEYIKKLYENSPKEYIDYIKETNKNSVAILKDTYIQENVLPFNNDSYIKVNDCFDNDKSVMDIYNSDPLYNKIPFDSLSKDQIQTMCNKYFKEVLKQRLDDFNKKLNEVYGIKYYINYTNQYEKNLKNYGITGNTPPFDLNNRNEIMISMYPNINYCNISGESAVLNTDLLGQIMISILHEHEHILQRIGLVDEELKTAIDNFDKDNPPGSVEYISNYANDPSEIDANLASFDRFIKFSKHYNIDNPEDIILNKVKHVINNAEDSMNFYKDNKYNNYNEVKEYLNNRLLDSINIYNEKENSDKKL